MRLNQLRTLLAVADAGSLRSAARQLGRTQPALTKTIHQLEEDLNAEVFQRTSRGIVLTEVGQIAVRRARTIIAEVERLTDDVNQMAGRKTGKVVISSLPLVSALILPAAMKEFRRTWPEIRTVVHHGFSPGAMRLLREGQLDIYIGPTGCEDKQSSLDIQPPFKSDIVIVCRKGHPNCQAKSVKDLLDMQWLEHGSHEGENPFFAGAFDAFGLSRPVPVIQSDTIALTASVLENRLLHRYQRVGAEFHGRAARHRSRSGSRATASIHYIYCDPHRGGADAGR